MLTALELRIPPPLLTLITALVMWSGARNKTPSARPAWLTPLALGIALSGLLLIGITIVTMRRAQTTVSPTRPDKSRALIRTGIFAVSRNPIYLGSAVLVFAYALYLWLPQSFVAVPIWIAWIQRFQIVPEERVLREKFAESFAQYVGETRRWV